MVRASSEGTARVYSCGYDYADEMTAESCEKYRSEHNACSFEITSKAMGKPSA